MRIHRRIVLNRIRHQDVGKCVRCRAAISSSLSPAPSPLADAFDEAQSQWLDLAMHPIRIGPSSVAHVLGLCHHDPLNPFLISATLQEIESPGASEGLVIALESSDTRLNVLKKALRASPSLSQTISALSNNPPASLSLNHTLSNVQLEQWHSDLNFALSSSFCLPVPASDLPNHFIMGHPQYSEELAACHAASLRSAPIIAIDLPVGHPLNEQASAFEFNGEVYEQMALAALDSQKDSGSNDQDDGSSLSQCFRTWIDEVLSLTTLPSSSFDLKSFMLGVLAVSCLCPAMMDRYNVLDREANPFAYDVVVSQRNTYMAQQVIDLATIPSGWGRMIKYGMISPDVAKTAPPGKILMIVGRSHVRGLIEILTQRAQK
jgi:hypothetical protein